MSNHPTNEVKFPGKETLPHLPPVRKLLTATTSHVERANLTVRMSVRRFTRLTNAYSKQLRNHTAAVSLFVAHYNLCRVHAALRVTPAMALGVTDHVWSLAELLDAALTAPAPIVPAPVPEKPVLSRAAVDGPVISGRSGTPALRLITGGKN